MYRPKLNSSFDLQGLMLDESLFKAILPGDLITDQEGYMNGHGTYVSKGRIYSSVLGSVSKTNKLILVNPLRTRYHPQVGHIVVGRVVEILNKRWKIDINGSSLAFLHLNAIYLPDQRKKTELDELNMRKILAENDLLVAEVHSVNNDRTVNLHTPNIKYGALEPGLLVQVDHKLVKRHKHHMIKIKQVCIILGTNGHIYLSNKTREDVNTVQSQDYTAESIKSISLLNSILKVLNFQGLQINEEILREIVKHCVDNKIEAGQNMYQNSLENLIRQLMRTKIPKRISELSKHTSLD